MSIRLQLLIIALTTLVLPFAGCEYAREQEAALRISQESALQSAASIIANALSAQSERVFGAAENGQPFEAAAGDLYVYPLHNQPLLDGYREDWDIAAEPTRLPSDDGFVAHVQAASTDRFLYLYLEVEDPAFDPEPVDVHPDLNRFDRVDIRTERHDGSPESYFFGTDAPGLIEAQRVSRGDDGIGHREIEPRIQAFWLQTTRGYALEARVPKSLVGARLWILVSDGGTGHRAGVAGLDPTHGGRLFLPTNGLSDWLATFIGTGMRATVVDANALKLASSGSLASNSSDSLNARGSTWFRRFIADDTSHWPVRGNAPDHLEGRSVEEALRGHASVQWLRTIADDLPLLSAAAPLVVGGQTRGAVVLEQAGDQLLDLRDRALNHLFYSTLLATALATAIAFGIAAWISLRIGRLKSAAEQAITPTGAIRLDMPESDRADEIGALAREFERLLSRLNENALYLRTLGGKLSHELRTPLTIVRSSLDNLESEGVRSDQEGYVLRAREGVQRLQSILSALGAASRVEESIKQAERVSFDLQDLVRSSVAGYQSAFPAQRIEVNTPPNACFIVGAPDLIVQMLDKLIENALDFCSPGGKITVNLAQATGNYELVVRNDGVPIPSGMVSRLFESLFEHRLGLDDRPHFGLGLYIVRLIAEFHGGYAAAANRPDGRGAIFSVALPLI